MGPAWLSVMLAWPELVYFFDSSLAASDWLSGASAPVVSASRERHTPTDPTTCTRARTPGSRHLRAGWRYQPDLTPPLGVALLPREERHHEDQDANPGRQRQSVVLAVHERRREPLN